MAPVLVGVVRSEFLAVEPANVRKDLPTILLKGIDKVETFRVCLFPLGRKVHAVGRVFPQLDFLRVD